MNGTDSLLLLPAGVGFAAVERAAEALGWTRDPDRTAVDPADPTFASWSRGFDGEMEYLRDPSTGTRVLQLRGEDGLATLLAIRGRLAAAEIPDPASALREARARSPGRSVLFPRLGPAAERRQVVRWLVHDRREANRHVLEVLRSALDDADWEVRASAMIAAARLGARELGPQVRRMEIPRTSRSGLDAVDRDVLVAARAAAVALLAGEPAPPAETASGEGKSALRAHLARCVAGEPPVRHDRVFLLIHSLATPVPPPEPPPPMLPALVATDRDGIYRLEDGSEYAWIPPVPHWLGDDPAAAAGASPARLATPPAGYFAAVRPLVTGVGADEARRACEELAARGGIPAALPTSDEWEMAVRGPDARRFPWGNGYDPGVPHLPSPWGVEAGTGIAAQWIAPEVGGPLLLRGGPPALRCAAPPEPGERGAVRPVLRPAR